MGAAFARTEPSRWHLLEHCTEPGAPGTLMYSGRKLSKSRSAGPMPIAQ